MQAFLKQAFLKHKEKRNKFQMEIITGYDTLVSMGKELKTCMSSHELGMELTMVVQANAGINDMSIWGVSLAAG